MDFKPFFLFQLNAALLADLTKHSFQVMNVVAWSAVFNLALDNREEHDLLQQ